MTTNGSTGKIMFGIADAVERAGGVTECAAPIVFLLSDDASAITASDLPVDSGYMAAGPVGYPDPDMPAHGDYTGTN